MNSIKGREVLITGGSGFIGQHLIKKLLDLDCHVTSLDVRELPALEYEPHIHLTSDITDRDAIEKTIEEIKPAIVFHLAAKGVTDPFIEPEDALATNLLGTLNIASAAVKNGVKKIIVTGTSHELGDQSSDGMLDPISLYAASKAATWIYLKTYYRLKKWPIVYLRLFQVYGPGQKGTLIPLAISHGRTGEPLRTTGGEQIRDWIYIDDVTEALITAASANGCEGKAFDVGTCEGRSVKEVLMMIASHFENARFEIGALPYRDGETWDLRASKGHLLPDWVARTPLKAGILKTIQGS